MKKVEKFPFERARRVTEREVRAARKGIEKKLGRKIDEQPIGKLTVVQDFLPPPDVMSVNKRSSKDDYNPQVVAEVLSRAKRRKKGKFGD